MLYDLSFFVLCCVLCGSLKVNAFVWFVRYVVRDVFVLLFLFLFPFLFILFVVSCVCVWFCLEFGCVYCL